MNSQHQDLKQGLLKNSSKFINMFVLTAKFLPNKNFIQYEQMNLRLQVFQECDTQIKMMIRLKKLITKNQ